MTAPSDAPSAQRNTRLTVGDRVRLSALFLRSTGQRLGEEGAKTWTVVAVDGDFVTVDERGVDDGLRRINGRNLIKRGNVDASDVGHGF